MCPDRQIISLYLDGELPSPWKEKMTSHLETCPECRAALAVYYGLRERSPNEERVLAAQERVWKKLTAPPLAAARENPVKQPSQRYRRQNIWNRSFTVPLPAAVAAAVVIIIAMFAILGLGGRNGGNGIQDTMAVIPNYMQVVGNEQGMVPMTDMTSVLQYLSSMDNGEFMVIRLPESKNFIRAGEPAFINAADYSRRHLPR